MAAVRIAVTCGDLRRIGRYGDPMARAWRLRGACAALTVVALIGAFPRSAWPQTPARVCAGPLALVNGGFEEPTSISTFAIKDQGQVPGWGTTEADGRIELWQSGYKGVPAASGEQFAELAANEPGELYEDVATVPGTQLGYAVSHRGRDGVDTMQIQIGPPGVRAELHAGRDDRQHRLAAGAGQLPGASRADHDEVRVRRAVERVVAGFSWQLPGRGDVRVGALLGLALQAAAPCRGPWPL